MEVFKGFEEDGRLYLSALKISLLGASEIVWWAH